MALGQPGINIPRGKDYDQRAVAAALDAIDKRLKAIEAILGDLTPEVQTAILRLLSNQGDGFLTKTGPTLATRKIKQGAGVTVVHGDGRQGDPTISSP